MSGESGEEEKGGYRQINKHLNICAFDEYLNGQRASLEHLEDVDQITPNVLRVLGQNPGKFTFQGTNTFLVGTGEERILVDTGGGEKEWLELMKKTLDELNISISHVLLTHWHGDHTGGVSGLVKTYPHLQRRIYKSQKVQAKDQQDIVEGQEWKVEGATVRAIHVPGHAADHMCFILEEEQAMFTGDNVLGTGSSAVEDLGIFMKSLQRMYDENCPIGYPAHGVTIKNLPEKIKGELNVKFRRERQILTSLKKAKQDGRRVATASEIVSDIYGESVDEETRTMALEPFCMETLGKLASEDKVAFEMRRGSGKDRRWFIIDDA